jgi:hypothetical protein
VRTLAGHHLHLVVDPDGVVAAVLDLLDELQEVGVGRLPPRPAQSGSTAVPLR